MTLLNILRKSKVNYQVYTLLFLFISVHIALYLKLGIVYELEAVKYIDEGKYLLSNGHFSTGKYLFYFPIIFLTLLSNLFKFPLFHIILFQIILSGLALICFYIMCKTLADSKTAFWGSILLTTFLPFYSWNFYLYSDSFFLSVTIIFSSFLLTRKKLTTKVFFQSVLILSVVIFSRPNGLLFLIPYAAWIISHTYGKKYFWQLSALISVAVAGITLILINYIFKGGGDLDILMPFLEEHIICFVPEKSVMETNLKFIKTGSPLWDLFYYISNNIKHFIALTLQKLLSFFNLSRPYYSPLHNTYLIAFTASIYILFLAGISYFKTLTRPALVFIITLLISYPLMISFQCNDWHGRFTLAILPYLIFGAGLGIKKVYLLIQKK